jgi:hypothetical protein
LIHFQVKNTSKNYHYRYLKHLLRKKALDGKLLVPSHFVNPPTIHPSYLRQLLLASGQDSLMCAVKKNKFSHQIGSWERHSSYQVSQQMTTKSRTLRDTSKTCLVNTQPGTIHNWAKWIEFEFIEPNTYVGNWNYLAWNELKLQFKWIDRAKINQHWFGMICQFICELHCSNCWFLFFHASVSSAIALPNSFG